MIEGIFYSEFDDDAGPIIRSQDPVGCISTEIFDIITEYIIPKAELCHRSLIITTVDNRRVMGFPMQIEHKRYARNSILFNVCFVFSSEQKNLEIYKPVLQKLAETFRALEVENGYLYDSDKKMYLMDLLPRIRTDLNLKHQCYIVVSHPEELDSNVICLRIFPTAPSAFHVNLNFSPIPLYNPDLEEFWENQEQLSLEDLGLRASVLAIKDNERLHVRRKEINPINRPKRYELQTICENNKMDPAFVASAVQILTACKLLNTVPPFDYNAFYAVTERIHILIESKESRSKCIDYVKILEEEYLSQELYADESDFEDSLSSLYSTEHEPNFNTIFSLYCALDGSQPFLNFLKNHNLGSMYIHERRFIMFGLVNGIVKQLGL